jgi:hypothetical protein
MHHSYTDASVLASLIVRVGFALFNLKLRKGAVTIPACRPNSTQELRVDGQPFSEWAAAWEAAPEPKHVESHLSATSMVAVRAVLVEYVRHMREVNVGVPKSEWDSIHMYEYVPDPDHPHLVVQLPDLRLCPPPVVADNDAGDIEVDVLSMLVDDGPVPDDDVSSDNSSSVHEVPEQDMGDIDPYEGGRGGSRAVPPQVRVTIGVHKTCITCHP